MRQVRSSRLRPAEHRALLDIEGLKTVVIEAQGALYFGSTEHLLRRIAETAETARFIIVDFKRVHLADASAVRLIARATRAMRDGPAELVFAEIGSEGALAALSHELAEHEIDRIARVFRDLDAALEWCEDQLVAASLARAPEPKYALAELDAFRGLSGAELRLVETIVRPLIFDKGELIIREGDKAKLFFALARGNVSVQIRVPSPAGDKTRRIATLGPGLTFGEMALLDHGDRSADVVADERVVCYGIAIEQLHELAAAHPNILVTILSNLTREFSERLRRANDAIRALE